MASPARADDQQAEERGEPEHQAHVAQREAAHLVQVDDVERQHQTGADELEDDDREQELALARQVVPERAEREGGGPAELDIVRRVFQGPGTVGESYARGSSPTPRLRLMKRLVAGRSASFVVVLVLA